MLSQQPGACHGGVHSHELHALVARLFTAHDRDVSARQLEDVREECQKRIVGGAVNRWCGEPYQDGITPHSIDATASCPWNDADIDDDRGHVNCG